MKTLSYSNKIVLYVEYENYVDKENYKLYLNGRYIARFSNAHYVLDDLEYDKEYLVEIKQEDKITFSSTVKTGKKKNVIEVDVDNRGIDVVTSKIQAFIDSASQEDVLYFPKGIYLTGALFFKSNQEVYLEEGCIILGSSNPDDYLPKIKSRFEGISNITYASLINVGEYDPTGKINTSNFIIHGKGKIFGGGMRLYKSHIQKESSKYDDKNSEESLKIGRSRGRLIHISNTENIIIDGIKMASSPSWNLHCIFSKNIYIHSNKLESFKIRNGDGIVIDSSSNAYIFNNIFKAEAYCVTLKSGKNKEGNIINIPTEDVYIFDNIALKGHGCSIGSELSGGIQNVFIYNCKFLKTLFGLHIKTTKKRGGFVKNIYAKHCSFSSINIGTVPYNDDGEGSGDLTKFTNFHFQNIDISGIKYLTNIKTERCKYIDVQGFEEDESSFNNFTFKNIKLLNYSKDNKGYEIVNALNTKLEDIIFREENK